MFGLGKVVVGEGFPKGIPFFAAFSDWCDGFRFATVCLAGDPVKPVRLYPPDGLKLMMSRFTKRSSA